MDYPTLRQQIGQQLGFGHWWAPFTGNSADFLALAPADQIKLTNAMRDYILAHPGDFTQAQVTMAATVSNVAAPVDYTIGDMARDFTGEVVNQAESLNPLSEQNRGKLAAVLVGLAALAIVAYVLPRALAAKSPKVPAP